MRQLYNDTIQCDPDTMPWSWAHGLRIVI